MKQHTLKRETSISGIGLHTGKEVTIRIKPAGANAGITFIRADRKGKPRIKAELDNVTSTVRGTNLGGIFTVEHLLSALYSTSVNNAEIEITGSEPPALDGSSLGFCRLIKKAGIAAQRADMRRINLTGPISVGEEGKCIIAVPSDRFIISFMLNYPSDFIGSQFYRFQFGPKDYLKDIAPARTYGFLSEVSGLKRSGLAKGASRENAVVIGVDRYLTKLRFKDELVRHKILDLIGDLSLLGADIKAHIICIRSGHDLNIKLAKKISREVD
jgi:UDP-3-O-[3-hydroxymyristoyl] N-acetylglucosamine deacetylase